VGAHLSHPALEAFHSSERKAGLAGESGGRLVLTLTPNAYFDQRGPTVSEEALLWPECHGRHGPEG
jgi:hypothetical protein